MSAAVSAHLNGFPQDPSFFPIAVWLQSPSKAAAYKAIGVNTFVGLWNGPTEDQLSQLAEQHIFAVTAQNEVALRSPHAWVIKAWMQDDEPDNAQPNAFGRPISCITATEVARRTREIQDRDPTRPVFINFGRGVADVGWLGRGTCTGDTAYYRAAAMGAGIVSFDIYPIAASSGAAKGKLEYVARGVSNLSRWAPDTPSIWAILETTRIYDPKDRARPDQIRASAWLALIHGAKGIGYFVHEFTDGVREDGIFRYPDAVDGVTQINAEIRSLASVLNSPSLQARVTVSGSIGIATMVKEYDGSLYVFAAATTEETSKPVFELNGIGNATATVLGENRTVVVENGILTDDFTSYGVHLYRIAHAGP